MKLVTYSSNGNIAVGVLTQKEDGIYPIETFGLSYKSMLELIGSLTDEERNLIYEKIATGSLEYIPYTKVKLLAPIPKPTQDLICLGGNYSEHNEEAKKFVDATYSENKDAAIYFSKRVNEAVAPGDYIDSHADIVKDLDYETELAVVIGKTARNVRAEDAEQYVFGYTIVNDISARTIQLRHKQWYFGKSLDRFTPMGPCIVTADEFTFPPNVRLQCTVNGELRQDIMTDRMIHKIPWIIEELSSGITLLPGTIIITGTPSGVGLGYNPPKLLIPGDVIECSIEGIGKLHNTIK